MTILHTIGNVTLVVMIGNERRATLMATLFIRNFPQTLKNQLKARAALEERTLYWLVVDLLERAMAAWDAKRRKEG